MAELTHLNEPSVVHNLRIRYQSDLIYVSIHLRLNTFCSNFLDLLGTVPGDSQSLLPASYILERIREDVQRAKSR